MLLLLSWDIAGFREAQRHRRPFLLGERRQAAPCEQGPSENRPQAAEGADSKSDTRSYRSGFARLGASERVRVALLAEFHVWTSGDHTGSRVTQRDDIETGLARFVYCLGASLKCWNRLGLLQALRGTTMDYHAGIDVSLEASSVCVVDASGKIMREAKVLSEPENLIGWFRDLGLELTRIGLEAGPLSQWLYAAMKEEGLAVELLETRHVHDAFKAMPVKSDRNDARGIAQLMRLGWFRPVHCKSMPAQEVRALLTARKLVQSKLFDIEMSLRGILRGLA